MKAIVCDGKKGVKLADVPEPELKEGQVLVKVKAAAQNPTDWKGIERLNAEGATIGCDFAGVVDEVAPGVNTPAKGTRVAGFVQGNNWKGVGAFAEYVAADHDLVWIVPEKTSFEEAAAIGGIAAETAAQAFYIRFDLNDPTSPVTSAEPVLVWAGSTSVGQYAIQLAHQAGYKVVTTASPKNFSLVKSLGADAAFDYKDPSTPEKIKAAYPDLKIALECTGAPASHELTAKSLSGGKLISLGPTEKSYGPIEGDWTLVYWTRGYPFTAYAQDFPAFPEERAKMVKFLQKLGKLVEEGKLVPNKVKKMGGLEKVEEGLKYMTSGQVSAEKLVYTI